VGGGKTPNLAPLDVAPPQMHPEEVRRRDDRDGAERIALLEPGDLLEEARFESREGPEEDAMTRRAR